MINVMLRDAVTGGACTYDATTGLPDCTCVFIPEETPDTNVPTSIMSTPFLISV